MAIKASYIAAKNTSYGDKRVEVREVLKKSKKETTARATVP